MTNIRTDSRFVPSQWETPLLCNDVSHWLGANLESVLKYIEKSYHSFCHFSCLQNGLIDRNMEGWKDNVITLKDPSKTGSWNFNSKCEKLKIFTFHHITINTGYELMDRSHFAVQSTVYSIESTTNVTSPHGISYQLILTHRTLGKWHFCIYF